MIIISQDKDGIINFDNINEIRTTKTGKILLFDNTYRSQDDCSDVLGKYKTEERAKEVLQEIAQTYSSYLKLEGGPAILQGQIDIQPNIFNIPKVYEMPKE